MQQTLRLLRQSKAIKNFEVIDAKVGKDLY